MSKYERKAQSQRKHGPLPDSGASKAPIAPPARRPGDKGPSYVKKQVSRKPAPRPSGPTSTIQEQLLPTELQQLVLDIFRDTFPASKDFETLKPVLQDIKDALFQRDFERAFGREEFLEAYAVRWSPSRTLGYANLLGWICGEKVKGAEWVKRLIGDGASGEGSERIARQPAKVVCFGGGAAEVMAFAGLLRHLRSDAAGSPPPLSASEDVSESLSSLSISGAGAASTSEPPSLLDLHLVDTANWSSVTSKLHGGLVTPPTLSKYASAASRASNASFLSSRALNPIFTQANVLESSIEDLRSTIGPDPALVTLLFTLNELYQASIPKTTAFLIKLTAAAPKDSLLLVVDSPGSYSEITAGNVRSEEEKKTFPMHWLMDRALLPKPAKKGDDDEVQVKAAWEKVVDEESRWYRLEEDLKYPVSLENMRFQVHLFKRV